MKENPDVTINKYEARLVTKGYHQQFGFNFNETFSLVKKPTIISVILTMTLTNKLDLGIIDINNFFLNGSLLEDVYMYESPEFENKIQH